MLSKQAMDGHNPLAALIAGGAPAHYAPVSEEYAAARQGCAVFPAAHRGFARVTGEDRVSFLHGMLTNDVRSLAPGHGQAAAFLTDSGKVVADLRLYCDTDGFDLDCLAWGLPLLRAGLEKFIIADDVEISTADERSPLACLEGPNCRAVAAAVFATTVDLAPYAFGDVSFDGQSVRLHAVSEFGGDGLLAVGPLGLREPLLDACRRAGARPAGLNALNLMRVEAGVPWLGIDMGEDTLLMEIGLPETISRTKGCYLGQEVVERVSARGQVNRSLTAFAIAAAAEQLPAASIEVLSETGAAVGRVTSWVESPALGAVLGMGLLHRKGRDAAILQVATPTGTFRCRVTAFPAAGAS